MLDFGMHSDSDGCQISNAGAHSVAEFQWLCQLLQRYTATHRREDGQTEGLRSQYCNHLLPGQWTERVEPDVCSSPASTRSLQVCACILLLMSTLSVQIEQGEKEFEHQGRELGYSNPTVLCSSPLLPQLLSCTPENVSHLYSYLGTSWVKEQALNSQHWKLAQPHFFFWSPLPNKERPPDKTARGGG